MAWKKQPVRIAVGFLIGALIAAVDNLAFGGEVSPIVIFALLLVGSAGMGSLWGTRGWPPALAMWICIPAAHIIKHVLGMADTIQPNTYASILLLAAVTLAVTLLGAGGGVLGHRLASQSATGG
jgi:hypothetical protein